MSQRKRRHFASFIASASLLLLCGTLWSPGAAAPELPSELLSQTREEFGPAAAQRLRHWQRLMDEGRDLPLMEKLNRTNRFFNGARFVDDQTIWNTADYWATPVEFLSRDAGDCEDFSVAKYFTLKNMGVDSEKLRLTYVKARTLNQAHMVLAYYPRPDAMPLILDNLDGEIKPADQRPDLEPVYSFNSDHLWLARTRHDQVRAGSPASLEQWRRLQQRLEAEGTRYWNP